MVTCQVAHIIQKLVMFHLGLGFHQYLPARGVTTCICTCSFVHLGSWSLSYLVYAFLCTSCAPDAEHINRICVTKPKCHTKLDRKTLTACPVKHLPGTWYVFAVSCYLIGHSGSRGPVSTCLSFDCNWLILCHCCDESYSHLDYSNMITKCFLAFGVMQLCVSASIPLLWSGGSSDTSTRTLKTGMCGMFNTFTLAFAKLPVVSASF